MARPAVDMKISPGSFFKRQCCVRGIGHWCGQSLGRGGQNTDVSQGAELGGCDFPVIVVSVELRRREAVERAAAGCVAEDAFGSTCMVPALHPLSAWGRGVGDCEEGVTGNVFSKDCVGCVGVPDVVVRLPGLTIEMQQLGFYRTSRSWITCDQVERDGLGEDTVHRECQATGDVSDLDVGGFVETELVAPGRVKKRSATAWSTQGDAPME